MKLVSFSITTAYPPRRTLLEDGNRPRPLGQPYNDTLGVIAAGLLHVPVRRSLSPRYPLAEVRLHAPLSNPPRIFAIGANYREHAKETGMALPTPPSSSSK